MEEDHTVTLSRATCHITKLILKKSSYHLSLVSCVTVSYLYSNCLHSDQIINPDSHHRSAANKSTATVWCYPVNIDQNLWGMFPTPSLNPLHEELGQSWRQKGEQTDNWSRVYLIKWLVSVGILLHWGEMHSSCPDQNCCCDPAGFP